MFFTHFASKKHPPGFSICGLLTWNGLVGDIGDMEYYHTVFEEYQVIYPDGTSDYIIKGASDGVQFIL